MKISKNEFIACLLLYATPIFLSCSSLPKQPTTNKRIIKFCIDQIAQLPESVPNYRKNWLLTYTEVTKNGKFYVEVYTPDGGKNNQNRIEEYWLLDKEDCSLHSIDVEIDGDRHIYYNDGYKFKTIEDLIAYHPY